MGREQEASPELAVQEQRLGGRVGQAVVRERRGDVDAALALLASASRLVSRARRARSELRKS